MGVCFQAAVDPELLRTRGETRQGRAMGDHTPQGMHQNEGVGAQKSSERSRPTQMQAAMAGTWSGTARRRMHGTCPKDIAAPSWRPLGFGNDPAGARPFQKQDLQARRHAHVYMYM